MNTPVNLKSLAAFQNDLHQKIDADTTLTILENVNAHNAVADRVIKLYKENRAFSVDKSLIALRNKELGSTLPFTPIELNSLDVKPFDDTSI